MRFGHVEASVHVGVVGELIFFITALNDGDLYVTAAWWPWGRTESYLVEKLSNEVHEAVAFFVNHRPVTEDNIGKQTALDDTLAARIIIRSDGNDLPMPNLLQSPADRLSQESEDVTRKTPHTRTLAFSTEKTDVIALFQKKNYNIRVVR